jgi:hypothetical protein
VWDKKLIYIYMAIRSKVGFNNLKKISKIIRVYKIVEKLKAGYKIGSSQFIKLIIKFYTLYLTNCKSIANFSS